MSSIGNVIYVIASFMAIFLYVISIQFKKKKDILTFQLFAAMCYFTVYITKGTSFLAVNIEVLEIIKNVVFISFERKNKKIPVFVLLFFIFVLLVLSIVYFESVLDFIPLTINIILFTSTYFKNPKYIRRVTLISGSMWAIFNIYCGTYIITIGNFCEIISAIIAIWRYKKIDNEFDKLAKENYSIKAVKKYDGIIFDLDGTLWDTVDNSYETLESIRKKHKDFNIKKISKNKVISSMGKTFDEIADFYYGYLPKNIAKKLATEALNEQVLNIKKNGGILYKNTISTIKELSKYYKLYIVSNCIDGYIETFITSSGLKDCFCDFESNGRTGLNKGDNLKLLIKRNKLKNVIYIGDTNCDKKSCDEAKIDFVFASYGFGEVTNYTYKIDDVSELIDIFIKN